MTRIFVVKYLVLCLLVPVAFTGQTQIVINEFMAANSSAVYDPDNDDSADWVELYNPSGSTVDLTGYFLTDNLSDTMKWAVPEGTTIAANGFLVFWADGTGIGIHTSFKFSSLGEEIGLYDSDLNLVDGFIYGLQETDISYGHTNDGDQNWQWFSESTPEASNNTATPYEGITYYEPFFSQKGGFFDGPQTIVLTSLGGEIRYTLDGSTPTQEDQLYTESISFNQTTFVRARVFVEGFIPGPTKTHSYFYDITLEDRALPVISLVTDPDFFWDAQIGLYVQDFKPEWEHPVNIEFFENDGSQQAAFNERAGVKVNGQNSWILPQKMLGIYFRNEYGSGNLDYPVFHDRERDTYDDLVLRAGGSDWASTLFSDGLCQSLTQENAPVGNQGFRQSMVFINGEYMGIHNMRSRLNGDYIEYNHGYLEGTFDLIDNDGEVDEGSIMQYQFMDSLFNTDLSVLSNYEELAATVDVENYTDYWINEIWCSNSSWGHNVKLWKPHGEGKWQFLLGDLDRGFSGSTNDPIDEFSVPEGNSTYDYGRIWLEHMFENSEYVKYFAQRFNDHIYTTYHPQRVQVFIDKFEGSLLPEIAYHVDRWSGTTSPYGNGIVTVEFWENEVLEFRQFAEERHPFMMTDLQETFGLAQISTLGTASLPDAGGRIRINEFFIPETPWSGPYFQNSALTLTAVPNPGYDFIGWSTFWFEPIFELANLWAFHDGGENLGSDWSEVSYDDTSWATGNAELGYGDGDETTVVSFGQDANNKHITTYFRKTFVYSTVDNSPVGCILNIRRDDGMVVYLNGVEITRSNMPTGEIDYLTQANAAVADDAEEALNEYLLELLLLDGENVIAVEIHQVSGQSSDISFDASLARLVSSEEIISNELSLAVTLDSDAGFIARYEPTGACLLPMEITEDMTLSLDCSPYMAQGDTYVFPDVSVTIDAGVQIWFPEESRLIVQGDLQVNGTENQGVLFKANTEYGAESWGNLTFENATGVSILNFMELRDATEGYHPIHNRAAMSTWYSEVVMDHLTMTDNLSNPIFCQYSDIELSNSLIHSIVTGDLINVKYGNAYISDCAFLGNDEIDTDAIDYDDVSDGIIRNSLIEGFYGFNSDGIDLGEGCQNVLIENCLINDCTDKGISIGQSSSAIVKNNTIVNCFQGLGIKDLGEAVLDHMTFYSNVTAVACFEKNPGFGGGNVSISNSILSNSSGSPVSGDDASTVFAENNFYDTDTMPGVSNVWMDPMFINPTHYNFELQPTSEAVEAGLDNEDLGTLDHTFESTARIVISQIQYYHPDDADKEFLKLLNSGSTMLDIGGYWISSAIEFVFPESVIINPGEEIMLVRDMGLFPDETGQIFEWTSGQLANEGEMILVLDNSGIIIDHVLYDPDLPWPSTTFADQYLELISSDLDNHFATSWVVTNQPIDVATTSGVYFNAYPNPATDYVIFVSDKGIDELAIYDTQGRSLKTYNSNSKTIRIDVVDYSPGLYLAILNKNNVIRWMIVE